MSKRHNWVFWCSLCIAVNMSRKKKKYVLLWIGEWFEWISWVYIVFFLLPTNLSNEYNFNLLLFQSFNSLIIIRNYRNHEAQIWRIIQRAPLCYYRDQQINNKINFCINATKIHKCKHTYMQTEVDTSEVEF